MRNSIAKCAVALLSTKSAFLLNSMEQQASTRNAFQNEIFLFGHIK